MSKTSPRTGRKRVSAKKKTGRYGEKLASWRQAITRRLGRQSDDLWGLTLIVFGVVIGLGYLSLAGPVGRGTVGVLEVLFGLWGYIVPVALVGLGVTLIARPPLPEHGRLAIGIGLVFFGTLAMFHLMTGTLSLSGNIEVVRDRGGAVGSLVAFPLRRVIGFWGAFVVLTAVVGIGVLIMMKTTLRDIGLTVGAFGRATAGWVKARRFRTPHTAPAQATRATRPRAAKPKQQRPKTQPSAKPQASPAAAPLPVAAAGSAYQLPPLELLHTSVEESGSNKRALEETGRELEITLRQHGVDAKLVRIVPGPTVTRFEIELAPGVKVSRVTGLSHDIAYALAASEVRILAPIPGKSAIGVEVPNRHRHLVTLGDVLRSPEADAAVHPLEVGLGKDINGTASLLNLTELPHVLIAGATGAGKSSCINALVTSLLVRTDPEEVKLILVDPKRVELGQYNGVPHLLTKVITNPKKAAEALQWAVSEMDRRYELLADASVRDIAGYREKMAAGMLDTDDFDRFPFLVIVVDELNDLMMVAGRAVEEAIVRIAQMARAVGIHLVLATQRPSVDVITGVIKANIQSRLAFSVASQADSRVIIDTGGAEKLVGLGDMLVVTARDPKPERIQGAWVSEVEIASVVEWVHEQQKASYEDEQVFAAAEMKQASEEEWDGEDPEIIRQALEIIVRSQLGSTSMLQRKLRIGFARAGRVMDILERRGIVGPSEGSNARDVLLTTEELEEMFVGA
ncbi:MAG: DNA translocase FtsK 4TM domain-containing protein [Acidimicrobiia bacterium]